MKTVSVATVTLLTFGIAALLAACAATPAAAPTPAPTLAPTPAPAGVVVTFRVADAEQYKLRLTKAADIAIVRKLLAGEEAPRIPNGVVVRGDPDVNTGYTWHIDPATIEFADATTEVCDGLPSDVEKGTITSDRYCPWSAKVVAIDG